MRVCPAALFGMLVVSRVFSQTYTISTFAGGGLPVNISGTSASLYAPQGVAVDNAGNLYFSQENTVLRLDAGTGVVTLVAGSGAQGFGGDDGPASVALLNQPRGVAVDSVGSIYIADYSNFRVRKVTNGVITTVAGAGPLAIGGDNGPAASALLYLPSGVAVDSTGSLYIADTTDNRIRKVTNGVITTVAGTGTPGFSGDSGPATSAQLFGPIGVAVDSAGDLYIADSTNNRIRKVTNGVITTVVGGGSALGYNGPAASAALSSPMAVAVDSAGSIYIADSNRVTKVTNGVITVVAGSVTPGFSGDNGPATSALLDFTWGVAVDSASNLYIADFWNNRIRKVTNGVISTAVGNDYAGFSGNNGPATSGELNVPWGLVVDPAGNIFVADQASNLMLKVSGGEVAAVAGNGAIGAGGDNGPATSAQLTFPSGVAVGSDGSLYIADTFDGRIRKVTNRVITTVAGSSTAGFGGDNGPATSALLDSPYAVAVDSAGNLYIADAGNARVRKVSNGVITTVAGGGSTFGDNAPATSVALSFPTGLALDSSGNLYIADADRVLKVTNGVIATVAGPGTTLGDNGPATAASLNLPYSVAVDSAGNLYIADTNNERIRKVTNGVITTVAGNGTYGFSGDNGPATIAQLNSPTGIAVDSAGNIYVSDAFNQRIRILTPGTLPAVSSGGVVPLYSTVPVVQPGSWISIFGSNLASGTFLWNGDFPESLGGTSVTIDNQLAYLWYVSPVQINLQVPDDTTTGLVSVVVNTASGSATSTVTLAPYAPSFSLLGDGKHVAGEILTPDGSGAYGDGTYDLVGPSGTFSYSTRPVKPGETLVLYGVGFGPTNPHVVAGQSFAGAAPTTMPVNITIGGVAAHVAFAGITEAGLYQFNLAVPFAGSGDQPVQASINGIQTPLGPVVTVQ